MSPIPLYGSPVLAAAREYPFATLTGCEVELVVAADLWHCNKCWIAAWPELRAKIRYGVFLDHLGGFVGRGTFAEVMELLGLGRPVWWFRGGEPTDSFRFGEANYRDWGGRYRPVMAATREGPSPQPRATLERLQGQGGTRVGRTAMSTPLTPQENVAYLEAIIERAMLGAAAAANAMARYIAERTAEDTLTRRKHPPGAYYKAKPDEPPSYSSGALAKSMYWTPSATARGERATAEAGSSDRRAALFEYGGCVLQPTDKPMLFWRDSGGWWSHRSLRAEARHPFLRPTVEDAVDDGELTRVAIDAFREYDP